MADDTRRRIIEQAQARQGIPYRINPPPDGINNLDCSLFVLQVLDAAGVPLPKGVRTAEQIRQATVPVPFDRVKPGELSIDSAREQAETGGSRYRSRLLLRRIATEVVAPPARLDLRNPFPGPLLQRYAAIARRCALLARHILAVLSARCDPQVRASVIKPISVDMVNLEAVAVGQPQQLTVKADVLDSPLRAVADVLRPNGVSVDAQAPTPLSRPFGVGGVDDRMSTDGSVGGTERKLSRPVFQDDRDAETSASLGSARLRAESRLTVSAILQPGQEVAAALLAGAWNGTLLGHPEPPTRGVIPPDVASIAGAFRMDILP